LGKYRDEKSLIAEGAENIRRVCGERLVALDLAVRHNAKTRHRGGSEYMALKIGDMAPDFELPAVEGERRLTIKLSDFRGKKHVVVTFHPLNWTPT
jgi:hypothetical protein